MNILSYEDLVAQLGEKFPGSILASGMEGDIFTIKFRPEDNVKLIAWLYQEPASYQFLTSLFAVHYPDNSELEVIYLLHNLVSNNRLRLKCRIPEANPVLPSLTPVFDGANWMERETYDFFGIQFSGHPDLRRILNVEDMIMFPLRKEFPLEDQTREDKNDLMFGR